MKCFFFTVFHLLKKSELALLNSCQAVVKQYLRTNLFGHIFMTFTRRRWRSPKNRQKLRTDARKRARCVKTSMRGWS